MLPISNSTFAYLYFTYPQSLHEVYVTIPEFLPVILSPFMIATLLGAGVFTDKARKNHVPNAGSQARA